MKDMQPRPEYPRPQFVRDQWLNLNGEWEFEFDDSRVGDKECWYSSERAFARNITVPFCFESKLSGIGETDFHDVVWYRKKLELPQVYAGKQLILHFGAVDYASVVWVNGHKVAEHIGGHTPFAADITSAVRLGQDNVIVVKAEDHGKDYEMPRGKQFWERQSRSIFYTRTTGIWQTVWLEAVHSTRLERIKLTPDIDRKEIAIDAFFIGLHEASGKVELRALISFEGEAVAEETITVRRDRERRSIYLQDFYDHDMGRLWSPRKPCLYDLELVLLEDGQEIDRVRSYFGMRKISIEYGKVCLNNRPFFMKLVLDQGYFPEGILTAPSDEHLRRDVELTKAMGFNGARKHQKVEDPRWLYWCDRLGLLVWGEMANACDYSEKYVKRITSEWQEAVERDYNHPSVVAWVPINESWGVPNIAADQAQQHHALAMYYLTKSLDPTRPVISNDGWEHMTSDICTIHDYEWREAVLEERYSTAQKAVTADPARRRMHVGGTEYRGEPIQVSEFGGISFKKSDWEGWGYSGADSEEDFIRRLTAVIRPLLRSPVVQGFCYTQLTDVEQEINGLLTYDRQPKVPLETIRNILDGTFDA